MQPLASRPPANEAAARPPVREEGRNFGHVIEYIEGKEVYSQPTSDYAAMLLGPPYTLRKLTIFKDRLYLAAYTSPPGPETPFPYARLPQKSPSKRFSKQQNGPVPVATGPKVHPPVYLTVDDHLLYNRFFADFGPLHIGHLYRFSVYLHEILQNPDNEDRGIVFWSKPDAKSRANAACLLACYLVVLQGWPPHLALGPIAQAEPPMMPFRDAGYSQADFSIHIQDVVYGVWKAKEEGLCGFQTFNLNE